MNNPTNNTLIDKIKEMNGKNIAQSAKFLKAGSPTNPISINFSLLSNKTAIGNLIAKAKENKGTKENPVQEKPNVKLNIEIIDEPENEVGNDIPRINVNPELTQSAPLPNFIRPYRKAKINTTQERGQLNIIKDLMAPNSTNNKKSLNRLQIPENCFNFIHSPKSSPKSPASPISLNYNNIEVSKITQYYTVKSSTSVIGYSYKEDQNRIYKETMEDKSKSIDNFNGNTNNSLFCVFDGHGGDMVARFLQKNFDVTYKKKLGVAGIDIETALKTAFKEVDNEIKKCDFISMGSTGCVVHVIKESVSSLKVYCANIGDTRCSLISPVNIKRLSYDHKASDPTEKNRILKSGGSVINDRVMGQLMLSRAFGDFEFKSFGVKSDPYISKTEIDLNEKNQFLILACDGIWDVLSEDDIKHIIMFGNNDSEDLCKNIMKNALMKGAWDNLSLFVIKLT